MDSVRARAREAFPSVMLTLLSIIQALALEVLWSNLHEHEHLWAGGLGAVIGWLQVAAVLGGLILVWLFYISIVLRVVWVPRVRDSIIPFFIGIAEFVLAESLAPAQLALWFFMLAGVFAFSTWTSISVFTAARRDPENDELFAAFEKYTNRDWTMTAAFVGSLVLSGLAVSVFGPTGGVALFCVLLALLVIAAQTAIVVGYWHRSLKM